MPRLGVLGFATLLIGAAVALPVVSVLASFFVGASDTWQHLATTALPRYIGNTLALLLLVSAGVISAPSTLQARELGATSSSGR